MLETKYRDSILIVLSWDLGIILFKSVSYNSNLQSGVKVKGVINVLPNLSIFLISQEAPGERNGLQYFILFLV